MFVAEMGNQEESDRMLNSDLKERGRILFNSPIIIILLFMVFILLRIAYLGADSPASLSWSRSPYGHDEGLIAHNARNMVLFGKWFTDEFTLGMYVYPVLNYIQFVVFSVFGVGLIQARAISIVFSGLTLLFFYLAIKESYGRRTAIVGFTFLGLNYVFIMHNRLALVDTPTIFFLVLTFFFWQKGLRKPVWLLASGAGCAMVIILKVLYFFLLPVPFVIILYLAATIEKGKRLRSLLKACGYLVAGIAVVALLWAIAFLLPNWKGFFHFIDTYKTLSGSIPNSVSHLFYNFQISILFPLKSFGYLLRRTPILLLVTMVSMGMVICDMRKQIRRDPSTLFIFVWLFLGILAFSAVSYTPPRYLTSMLPPMAALAAHFLVNLSKGLLPELSRKKSLVVFISILMSIIFLHLSYSYIPNMTKDLPIGKEPGLSDRSVLGISLMLALCCGALIYRVLCRCAMRQFQDLGQRFQSRSLAITAVVIILFLVVDLAQYGAWVANVEHGLVDSSREIGRILPPNSVLAGIWAPAFCLENNFISIPIYAGFYNDRELVERYKVTHVITEDGFTIDEYWAEKYPEIVTDNNLVRKFRIRDHFFSLYQAKAARH